MTDFTCPTYEELVALVENLREQYCSDIVPAALHAARDAAQATVRDGMTAIGLDPNDKTQQRAVLLGAYLAMTQSPPVNALILMALCQGVTRPSDQEWQDVVAGLGKTRRKWKMFHRV